MLNGSDHSLLLHDSGQDSKGFGLAGRHKNYGILMRSGSRDSYVAGIQGYASRNHHRASMNVGN